MIHIFHGDDLTKSRQLYLQSFKSLDPANFLHLSSKSINLDQINNFINGGSLFAESKVIAIDNFFSITKSVITKLSDILNSTDINVIIWQDKLLTVAQLKTFPKAIVQRFKADNNIFICINSLKPHNINRFIGLYHQICAEELFDLFFFLLKASVRKQLLTRSVFSEAVLSKTYLQMIELEYQYKTGQLSLSKEIALERVLLPLLR